MIPEITDFTGVFRSVFQDIFRHFTDESINFYNFTRNVRFSFDKTYKFIFFLKLYLQIHNFMLLYIKRSIFPDESETHHGRL